MPGVLGHQHQRTGTGFQRRFRRGWPRLMLWIVDHFFQDAKAEGWFDAILIQVMSYPRAIRTMEFSDHCSDCEARLLVPIQLRLSRSAQ